MLGPGVHRNFPTGRLITCQSDACCCMTTRWSSLCRCLISDAISCPSVSSTQSMPTAVQEVSLSDGFVPETAMPTVVFMLGRFTLLAPRTRALVLYLKRQLFRNYRRCAGMAPSRCIHLEELSVVPATKHCSPWGQDLKSCRPCCKEGCCPAPLWLCSMCSHSHTLHTCKPNQRVSTSECQRCCVPTMIRCTCWTLPAQLMPCQQPEYLEKQ